MLWENTSINDEIIGVDNVKKPVTFTSKMVRTAIVLTSVTVGAGRLGYLWNEITDQWTKDYPVSEGYNQEVENRAMAPPERNSNWYYCWIIAVVVSM